MGTPQHEKQGQSAPVSTVVFCLAYVCALALCAFLTILSVCVSCYPDFRVPLMDVVVLGSGTVGGIVRQLVAPLACAALLLVGLVRMPKVLKRFTKRQVVTCSVIAALAIQVIWIVMVMPSDYSSFADTITLTQLADSLLAGDYSVFMDESQFYQQSGLNPGDQASYYLNLVPYQAGGLFVFVAFRALFGAACYPAFQVMNALAGTATIALIAYAVDIASDKDDALVKNVAVSLALFLPFLFSCTFVYTNSLGLCLATGSIAVSVKAYYDHGQGKRLLSCSLLMVAAFALILIAMVLKPTLILIAIAEIAVWVVYLAREHKAVLLPLLVVLAIATSQASSLATVALEAVTGVEFGPGFTKMPYLVMGTSWSEDDDLPGWYHHIESFALESGGDTRVQNELALEALGENFSAFAADPGYAVAFFGEKLATEWTDPTYQAFWFSRCSIPDGHRPPALYIISQKSPANTVLVAIFDGAQTLLYACAAIELALCVAEARRRKFDYLKLLLAVVFLCGFGCYFFWEAQSMYLLPFALFLVPLAASGALRLSRWWSERRRRQDKQDNPA